MIESLRAVGYDLPTAIADLVDNSLAAGASVIDIDFVWNGERSVIAVVDNGKGMTEAQLVEAMRVGSSDPTAVRAAADLGRFGLGMKTASFSQCRAFTVYSKTTDGILATRRWDLDYVREAQGWRVLRSGTADATPFASAIKISGTSVVWENLDRLVAGTDVSNGQERDTFNVRAEDVERHLAMVFHRFMSGNKAVQFRLNTRRIEPWDPFMEHHVATQHPDPHILQLRKARIQVDCFVLPHHSKLTTDEHARAAGPRGWLAHQGFYIYRNRRLLVPGDWLDLGVHKEEHYKLARIRVDLPNTVDDLWQIDIRKSAAKVPSALARELRNLGRVTREKAVSIYRHRGKIIQRQHSEKSTFVWQQKVRHGKMFYHLNREHPLVQRVLREAGTLKSSISALLRLIEEAVPIPLIVVNSAERPDSLALPFESAPSAEIYAVMTELFIALRSSGLTERQALTKLLGMEPFDRFPEYVENLPEVMKARGVK